MSTPSHRQLQLVSPPRVSVRARSDAIIGWVFDLRVPLVVVHDPPLQVRVLLRHEAEGGQVGVVGVVLHHVIAALGWRGGGERERKVHK